MGLFDYLFDSEYKQRRDLLSLSDTTSVTTSTVDRVSSDLIALRLRVDRAELAAEAMFRLLQEKGMLTADELRTYIARIDLEDGREDGVMGEDKSAEAPKCPSCARPANFRRRTHCVYCGGALKPARSTEPYR